MLTTIAAFNPKRIAAAMRFLMIKNIFYGRKNYDIVKGKTQIFKERWRVADHIVFRLRK
jgi:hypothetical protein